MAYRLERARSASTPYILVDEEQGYMKFEGDCFHENVIEFFKEIHQWLKAFLQTAFETLTFDCQLEYFNSSTAKLLFNMLIEMDEHAAEGKTIIVNWITANDNDIIIECGEDFSEEMEHLIFNVIIA